MRSQAERRTRRRGPESVHPLNMHFVVRGRSLKPEAVERAVKLSAEKYCSASIMLGKTAEMSHSWEVIET